jgi:uncharacterized protein (DUF2345 family)
MTIDSRPSHFPRIQSPGPYEAVIVSHLDPKYMGSLRVELLKSSTSGNQPERTGQIITAHYMNPFYGVTPISSNSKNDDFESTQKSYGMWFVPPDVGSRVLVIFVEGNISRAFWIGCVQDTFMNFMTPDPWAGTTFNGDDQERILPVGEFNKKTESANGSDPTKYIKPVNRDFAKALTQQGLLEDNVRGISSSSARREVPSAVFGMSTPGPVDKRPNAPKTKVGPAEAKANVFSSRLGGSSLIFDDGDDNFIRKGPASSNPSEYADLRANESGGDYTLPSNELVRLRTRTGHQILLHNTEDLIYIANARGTAWIELTSNGKIDIYSGDSISIHSGQDLNFTADRDINFTAQQNFNLVAGGEARLDVGSSYSLTAGGFIASNSGSSITENAQGHITNYSSASITHVAQNNLALLSNATLNIGATGEIGIEATGSIKLSTDQQLHLKALTEVFVTSDTNIETSAGIDTKITSGTNSHINSGSTHFETAPTAIHMNGPTAELAIPAVLPPVANPVDAVPPVRAAQTSRVPQHEPWYEHENINPQLYTPDRTRAGQPQQQSFAPPQNDTFTRGTSKPERRSVQTTDAPPQFDATRATRDAPQTAQSATGGSIDGSLSSLPAGTIVGFTEQQTLIYLNNLGQRESGNKYDVINTIGFAGKYQFGAAALETFGYLKVGTSRAGNRAAMSNPDNWTGKNGCNNLNDWLTNNNNVQEIAIIELTNGNKRTLTRVGGIKPEDDLATQAGMMCGAHLLGPGGITKWRRGEGGRDAYGTTGDEYFNLGKRAIV